ncbi:MAG: cytochrome c oxidase assembly protein [Solirubrobacteraceae bacterium]
MLIAVQAAVVAALGALYLARVHKLRGSPDRPAGWRILCLCAGMALEIAATVALEGHNRELLYLATLEQIAIADLGALLVALSLTEPVLRPLRSIPVLRELRRFALPSVAMALWLANTAAWHVPVVYEAALGDRSLMLLEHLLLATCGLAVWLALLGPGAAERWRERPGRWIGYAMLWRAVPVALGASGVISPDAFYVHYVSTDVRYTISPLFDQGLAGCILIGESALVAIGLLIALYVRIGPEGGAEGRPLTAADHGRNAPEGPILPAAEARAAAADQAPSS